MHSAVARPGRDQRSHCSVPVTKATDCDQHTVTNAVVHWSSCAVSVQKAAALKCFRSTVKSLRTMTELPPYMITRLIEQSEEWLQQHVSNAPHTLQTLNEAREQRTNVPITHAPRDQCTDVFTSVIESSAPQYLPGYVCRLYDSGCQSRLAACVQRSAGSCRRRKPRSIRSRSSNSSYKIICKSCMPKRCECAVPVLSTVPFAPDAACTGPVD